jgi:hypothetical protein
MSVVSGQDLAHGVSYLEDIFPDSRWYTENIEGTTQLQSTCHSWEGGGVVVEWWRQRIQKRERGNAPNSTNGIDKIR